MGLGVLLLCSICRTSGMQRLNYQDLALTYSHHRQLHNLSDGDRLVSIGKIEEALKVAAVSPCVIEGDIVNENGTDLHIARSHGALPFQTVFKVIMQNERHWVLIVENLQKIREGIGIK